MLMQQNQTTEKKIEEFSNFVKKYEKSEND